MADMACKANRIINSKKAWAIALKLASSNCSHSHGISMDLPLSKYHNSMCILRNPKWFLDVSLLKLHPYDVHWQYPILSRVISMFGKYDMHTTMICVSIYISYIVIQINKNISLCRWYLLSDLSLLGYQIYTNIYICIYVYIHSILFLW